MAPTPDTISTNGTTYTEDYYKTEETQYSAMSHAGVVALVVFIIVAILSIAGLAYFLYRRRQNRAKERVFNDSQSTTQSVAPAWSSFWNLKSDERGDRPKQKVQALNDGDSIVMAHQPSDVPCPPPSYDVDRWRSEVHPPVFRATMAGR